ncbi:MAG: hypothetical protein PVF08_06090 [Gammaproteobacteria bacterium]|jgi:hypothetical protein
MYKWLTILVMLLVVVEPVLGLLERYGIGRDMALVCAMSLVLTPWVVAQFDN